MRVTLIPMTRKSVLMDIARALSWLWMRSKTTRRMNAAQAATATAPPSSVVTAAASWVRLKPSPDIKLATDLPIL
jgi:hypothetical protein